MDMSLIENAYQAIVNDELMNKAIPNIVYRSSIVNYKINKLKNALKMGEEEQILKYVSTAEDFKSILNATITDGDDEVQVISRELGGLQGLDERSAYRLAAAFGIPATVLWGKSPDGMNATGQSDLSVFYNFVETWQNRWLENVRQMYKILIACVTGRDDIEFLIEYNNAQDMSPDKEAAISAAVLANAQAMRDMGLPDEAINRMLVNNNILTESEAEDYLATKKEMAELLPEGAEPEGQEPEEEADKEDKEGDKGGASGGAHGGAKITDAKEFDESEHPRKSDGQFAPKGQGEEASQKVNTPSENAGAAAGGNTSKEAPKKVKCNYKNVMETIKNFNTTKVGTYDLATGDEKNYSDGFCFSFHQNKADKNGKYATHWGLYTPESYDKLTNEIANIEGVETNIGCYDGEPEISFWTADRKLAEEMMHKYHQHSIYDVKTGDLIMNDKRDKTKNPMRGE